MPHKWWIWQVVLLLGIAAIATILGAVFLYAVGSVILKIEKWFKFKNDNH